GNDLPELAALDGSATDSSFDLPDLAELPSLPAPDDTDPADRLRGLIDERKEETVEVLSRWMRDEPEKAG
ncbi:MAG: flagellar M-ring protein FliF, partial [Planctomycetota bacterium]